MRERVAQVIGGHVGTVSVLTYTIVHSGGVEGGRTVAPLPLEAQAEGSSPVGKVPLASCMPEGT